MLFFSRHFQSFIKEEPEEYASDVDDMDISVDPTQFLAQDNDDDNDDHGQPPILASLGLTHISQVKQNIDFFLFLFIYPIN